MGYKIQEIYVWSQKVRPTEIVLFDYWDWTDSVWTAWPRPSSPAWNITKTSSYISFSGSWQNYLSEYPIDWTKDFLLEFNANIGDTHYSYHYVGLVTIQNTWGIFLQTNWEHYWEIAFDVNWTRSYSGETNPWTADYFIKKEWNVLTMWWGGVTKYTDSNYTFETEYYLMENTYDNTITINTAKLTYL